MSATPFTREPEAEVATAESSVSPRRLAPVDLCTLAYVAFVSLILTARWSLPLPKPGLLLLAHVLLVGVVLMAARLRRERPSSFLASFYPLALLNALYSELGLLNSAQGVAHDALVQSWEQRLFGGQPSLDWIRTLPSPSLSVVLHLAYLSYYFIIFGAPFGLWLSGRRTAAAETVFRIMVTFYACYVAFLLFPVAGPRYQFPLAANAATAVLPAQITHGLLSVASAWGTAFPSSHVAVALVASLAATAAWRTFGLVLLVDAILLTLGTVYGQFHYAVDALAGTILALLVLGTLGARRLAS